MGLKSSYAALRAAVVRALSRAPVVTAFGRVVCGLRPRHLGPKGLKNIHPTLWAAGFGVPLGATFVWPQGRAGCGMRPRHLGPKGSKKTFMQPCGLRDLACPRGRLSFGLKTGRVAECARGILAQRTLKTFMQPCRLRDLVHPRERLSFGLKAGRVADCIRGTLAQRTLKNIHATLQAAGFGAPLGATFVWPQDWASCGLNPRYPWPKEV